MDQSLINIETRSTCIAVFVLQGYVKLSDAEITERLAVTLSRRQKFMENKKKQEKINLQQTMAKRMMEAKMKQKLQHQGERGQ